jgi:hypothetical protein
MILQKVTGEFDGAKILWPEQKRALGARVYARRAQYE